MSQTKEMVMIVDDSKLQRKVLKELLQPTFDVIEASSGEECLNLIEHSGQKITMVLLDLVMPEVDGFEVLRRRLEMPDFRNIPVIVLTANSSIEFQMKAFEMGADEFIIKPVDDRVALARINNTLDVRRKMQSLLQKQQELKTMSEIDAMTQLFNKTTAEHLVTKTLIANPDGHHAMMVIDIDNFKAVNDQLGHKVGDHVITVVAGVISMQFGDMDYVGRIGGDEFVVFLSNIESKEAVRQKADALLQAIQRKENLSIPNSINLSIGLAFTSGEEKNYPTLFNKADHALYIAKKAGKGRYFEYGSQVFTQNSARIILTWTESRNVCSTLEYAYHQTVKIESVSSANAVLIKLLQKENQILAVYIDVSSQKDDGKQLWDLLKQETWIRKMPLIAICREGNLQQIKYAIESGIISDLIFAPLDAETVTRRARALGLIG